MARKDESSSNGNAEPPHSSGAKEAAKFEAEQDARPAGDTVGRERASPKPAPVSAAAPTKSAPASHPSAASPAGEAWGEPLARFEERWTWLETRLLTFVLVWQLASMALWVFL